MTETDSFRRGGKLPRDRDGYDAGTVSDGPRMVLARGGVFSKVVINTGGTLPYWIPE